MIYERAMELVVALRSGKYEQGKDQLHDGNKFCCLGVACEISDKGKWDRNDYYSIEGIERAHGNLPRTVQRYFGFKTDYAGFDFIFRPSNDVIGYASLVDMNDAGRSFSEIADFIERYWEHL